MSLGTTLEVTYEECCYNSINSLENCYKAMIEATKMANMTVVGSADYTFDPQGLSVVLLLSESHFAIHTFPEQGKVAVDCFTCGDSAKPIEILDVLQKAFGSKVYEYTIRNRK